MITTISLPLYKDWIVKVYVFLLIGNAQLYRGPFCLFSSLLLSEELPPVAGPIF
jgi:hypothetical protein